MSCNVYGSCRQCLCGARPKVANATVEDLEAARSELKARSCSLGSLGSLLPAPPVRQGLIAKLNERKADKD